MPRAPLAHRTISRLLSPDGLVPDDRETSPQWARDGNQPQHWRPRGREGRYAEKAPLNSRQENFVGWRWQSSRKLCHVRCPRSPRRASIERTFHQTAEGELFLLRATRQSHLQTPPARTFPIRCEARLQQSRELAAKTRMNLLQDRHPVNANFPSARLRLALYSPNGKP